MKTGKILLAMLCSAGMAASAPSLAEPGNTAMQLAQTHSCLMCHAIDKKVIGPAWKDVAARYRGQANAENQLVEKVSKGGKGSWDTGAAMPPFGAHVSEGEIRTLVRYILTLK